MIYALFNGRPTTASLPSDLNSQIINYLHDSYQPSINDAQPMVAWLTVQQEGLINLSLLNPKLCMKHLSRFVKTASHCWTSDNSSVVHAATTAV